MLGLLARSACGRDGISSQGGLSLIIDQIKQTSDPKIFRYCCFALGNLVTSMVDDSEGSFKQLIERERVIEIMLDTFRLNFHNWKVTQQICFAIGNLAFIGDFEPIIVSQQGIELVLSAMQKHSQIPLMMTDSIFFLKNFAFGEIGRSIIIANGGVPLIINAMSTHMDHPELVELAVNILFDLSFSGAVEIIMESPLGIQLILKALETHENNGPLIREALRTISRIYSIATIDQKKTVIRSNTVPALTNLLQKNSSAIPAKQIINALSLFARESIFHEKKTSLSPPFFEGTVRAKNRRFRRSGAARELFADGIGLFRERKKQALRTVRRSLFRALVRGDFVYDVFRIRHAVARVLERLFATVFRES